MGEKKGFRRYLGLTTLIGLGFFTMGMMDPLYDNYLPIFLNKYIESMAVVGAIMTVDNIFALFLIPIVSVWSDNTRTRIGRRMPFILITVPLSALFFGLIPFAAAWSLIALIAIVFLLNVFKQSARGPVVALMPDIIPGEYRSEANGIINMMSAIAAIIGTVGLARLMDLNVDLPLIGNVKGKLPFPIAGILVVLAIVFLFVFVRERKGEEVAKEERKSILASLKAVAGAEDKSALLILCSILFWFLGYQGVLPWVGKFSVSELGVSLGKAATASGAVAIAMTIFALPIGYVAHRIGRKKTIRICLIALTVISTLMALLSPIAHAFALTPDGAFYLTLAIMFFFGAFWIGVVVNSFPMLWQMATYSDMGIYTGLYYTFSQTAAIIAPPITGAILDAAGFPAMFAFCAVCMFVAFLVMSRVTRGEPREATLT